MWRNRGEHFSLTRSASEGRRSGNEPSFLARASGSCLWMQKDDESCAKMHSTLNQTDPCATDGPLQEKWINWEFQAESQSPCDQ